MSNPPNIEAAGARANRTDPDLLSLLVCPQTRGPLIFDRAEKELVSLQAGLAFPIRDAVPVMLVEAARVLSEAERARWHSKR